MLRYRDKEARGRRRKRHPMQPLSPGNACAVNGLPLRLARAKAAASHQAAGESPHRQQAEAEAPQPSLRREAEAGLDQERIGHQAQKAADIAGRIEEVRVGTPGGS